MCRICSQDAKESEEAKSEARVMAADLERLAEQYRMLTRREIDPHGASVKPMALLARSVLRRLFEEWF
jgi:hypothetical protein